MPVPMEYYHATEQFESFMLDARDAANLNTTNMAWNMVVGVFQAFRRRLSVVEALKFANVLPPGIRALFVADWDADEAIKAFSPPEELLDEIRSVRRQHNFSPDNAHEAVVIALRKNVNTEVLDSTLQAISVEAYQFWYLPDMLVKGSPVDRELKIHYKGR